MVVPDIDGIIARYQAEYDRIAAWAASIQTMLQEDDVIQDLRPILIKRRMKSVDSLSDKIRRKHNPPEVLLSPDSLLAEIEDLSGVRLVLAHKQQIAIAVDAIRKRSPEDWEVAEEKHYVWHPDELFQVAKGGTKPTTKNTGYCSRHFILVRPGTSVDETRKIKCELQIRTIMEEAIFENEHRIRYKGGHLPFTGVILTRLAELLESCDHLLDDAYKLKRQEETIANASQE